MQIILFNVNSIQTNSFLLQCIYSEKKTHHQNLVIVFQYSIVSL